MLSLTVCTQPGKCCINASGALPADPESDAAPARVFIGVGKSCSASGPPITTPTGSPAAGWIEASSITSIGSGNYQVVFPSFTSTDPRCVALCNAEYDVCIWVYYADGSSVCSDKPSIKPSDDCAAQSPGCPECANDESP